MKSPIVRLAFFSCLLVAAGSTPEGASAQTYFAGCVSMTGSDATLVVPASAAPAINGAPIAQGDELAIFTEDGLCAGVGVWSGADLVITVWGDDSVTETKDGFEADEALTFRAWDASDKAEAKAVDATLSGEKPYYRTRNTFETNAIYVVASLSASDEALVAPSSPRLTSPGDDARDMQLDPTVVWNAVEGAAHYRIQVSADPYFTSVVVDETGIVDTTYVLTSLAPATTYSWRVRAENEAGTSLFSPTRTFHTASPVLDNAPPTFRSKPGVKVKAGQNYKYKVAATDPDGDAIELQAVELPAWLSFTSNGANGELLGKARAKDVGTYTVELSATDAGGASTSQVFTITVDPSSGNGAPTAVSRVPKQQASVLDEPITVGLAAIFEDEDGDELTYEASVSEEGIVDLEVDGTSLFVEPLASGTVVIELLARDPKGEVGSASFEMTVLQVSSREEETPSDFALHANYPNPFNPRTTIPFTLDRPGFVEISLYNSLGQRVAVLERGERPSGTHSVHLDASDLPTGVYHYRLVFGTRAETRSMVLLR